MSKSPPARESERSPTNALRRATDWLLKSVQPVLEWIGRYEAIVLALLFVAALAIWTFIAIAEEVVEGDTLGFDEWAIRALRRPDDLARPIGPDWCAEIGRDLTALGGVTVLALITAAVCGFLWLRRMFGAMWLVLAATLGGLIASTLLKFAFARPRPEIVPHLSLVQTSSFPSGHSMLAATVYLTLGALLGRFAASLRLKAYFLLVALVLTFLVGASRVYMGVHYPTDVLAGWAAGLAWALLCWLFARYLQQRGAVERDLEMP